MKKIRFVGLSIVIILGALVFTMQQIDKKNQQNNILIQNMNNQKSSILNIVKNILYVYKNQKDTTIDIQKSIDKFVKTKFDTKSKDFNSLNQQFVKNIKKFQKQIKVTTIYSDIVLKTTVKDIYNQNLILITKLNDRINAYQNDFINTTKKYKIIQYILYILLFGLFLYLLYFILNNTTKFEILINELEKSIKSIEQIDQNVEKYLQDIDFSEDESIIIESLEELTKSNFKLKQLKEKLKKYNS